MKALDSVVLFKVDAEKGEGADLAKEYLVQGYPTFVLADAEGAVLDTWSGYAKQNFLDTYGLAVADPTTIDEKRARFEVAATAKDAKTLARFHGTRGEYPEAIALIDRAVVIEPTAASRFDKFYFTVRAHTKAAEDYPLAQVTAAAQALVSSPDVEPGQLVEVADMMDYVGKKAEQPRLVVPYLEPALKATEGTEDAGLAKSRQGLEIQHALLVLDDKDKARELKLASMPEGWKEDASGLNAFAWWSFENKVGLEDAELLARQGVELAAPGKERAMILDTAAELCNARGNCDDAVELMRQAVEEDPDSKYYAKQLTRFEELRAAQAN
jgi:tetratricopeptide (TPR) repeat protein